MPVGTIVRVTGFQGRYANCWGVVTRGDDITHRVNYFFIHVLGGTDERGDDMEGQEWWLSENQVAVIEDNSWMNQR